MKLDADEKELLESVEAASRSLLAAANAKATFRKDRPLNVRLSSKDLEAIQKRARGGLAVPDADFELAA